MAEIYLIISLSTHNGDDTPQNRTEFSAWIPNLNSLDTCQEFKVRNEF